MRRFSIPFPAAATLLLTLALGLPTAAVVGLALVAADALGAWALLLAPVAPPLAAALVALTAGLLSRPFRRAVRPGRMRRDVTSRDYRDRRLHGLCWTCVYYCPAVMHVCLALPPLRKAVFRLFGYRGALDFTVYPDTWMRDLPVLDLGPGCYVSNRATLGTNIVARGGRIHVDRIRIGARALVGHLAMLAPGVVIGADAEVGAGAGLGLRVRVGADARIGDEVVLDHGAVVGPGARVGTRSYVGRKAIVEAGAVVEPGTVVPAGAVVRAGRRDLRAAS